MYTTGNTYNKDTNSVFSPFSENVDCVSLKLDNWDRVWEEPVFNWGPTVMQTNNRAAQCPYSRIVIFV